MVIVLRDSLLWILFKYSNTMARIHKGELNWIHGLCRFLSTFNIFLQLHYVDKADVTFSQTCYFCRRQQSALSTTALLDLTHGFYISPLCILANVPLHSQMTITTNHSHTHTINNSAMHMYTLQICCTQLHRGGTCCKYTVVWRKSKLVRARHYGLDLLPPM